MYRSFYELKQKPFQITTDPKFLWLGEKHKEALSILKYGILDNKWFLLLTGDVGTGKTTLINALIKSLDDSVIVATVPDPGLDEMDLFNYIADLYGLDRTFTSKGEFLIHFRRFLNDAHDDGKKILLIIDEAQRLDQERLEVIRLLSNIELEETKLINIFFVGQNEFNHTLRQPANRALRQRITINYNITPLTATETAEYIAHRLKVAGAARQIFHPDAIRRVASFTGGYPRLINVLCDYALVTGYVKGARVITPAVIDECARELQIPHSPPVPQQRTVETSGPAARAAGEPAGGQPAAQSSSQEPPVAVTTRQARMPDGKKPHMTGLYLALGIILAVGILLYMMPDGFFSTARHAEKSPGEMEKPPAALVAPETGSAQKAASSPEAVASNQHSVSDASDSPAARTPPMDANPPKDAMSEAPAPPGETQPASDEALGSERQQLAQVRGGGARQQPAAETQPRESGLPPGGAAAVSTPEGTAPGAETPAGATAQNQARPDESSQKDAALEEQIRRLAREKKLLVYFGRNSNEMQQNTFAMLDALSVFMRRYPTARLVIRGYTDSSGVYSYNKKLSEFRANMVKSYLVGKGTDSSRIETLGMGPENPLKSNALEKTRRFNRRVEIDIVMSADQEG